VQEHITMRTVSPLSNVFDRMVTLSRAMDDAIGQPNNGEVNWTPVLDASETEHGWVVEVDLPGIAPESVDLTFDRNALTIRGARQRVESEKSRAGIRERAMGTFERTLRFPQHVDSDKIGAEFRHGVLTITVPKAESARPRKIAVSAIA
jgi:HSP20 family protein